MRAALDEARAAAERGEVPVGAVVVLHDEIIALREASKRLVNYRLAGAELYVTIEPCAMCAGAMIQARIARLVYGAEDAKGGAVRSCFAVLDHPQLNHRVAVTAGVLAEESAAVLKDFFAARR